MEKVVLYKYQLEEIQDALRMVMMLRKSIKNETCLDRTVKRAKKYAENALNDKININVDY